MRPLSQFPWHRGVVILENILSKYKLQYVIPDMPQQKPQLRFPRFSLPSLSDIDDLHIKPHFKDMNFSGSDA